MRAEHPRRRRGRRRSLGALDQVEERAGRRARSSSSPSDEDIHTAVERRVTELAGPAGGKLHTGRSRNDQVATDLRLYTKRALADVATPGARRSRSTLLARAEAAGDAYLPGYTHLQRAQPVLLAHHLLAHGWALARDVDRLLATRAGPTSRPLGAGALAGSSLAARPASAPPPTSASPPPFDNSLDAVSDRDFVAEALFDLALLGVHLSRIGEEIVLWSSEEFGFLTPRTTPTPPAARCCRRRRTPTSPSWPGARPAASSATSPACSRR